jgi:choline monooxygenase
MEFMFTPIPPPAQRRLPRIHVAARAGVGDLADSTMRIPNAKYTDPAIAAAELRTSFTAPLLVAPSRSIESAGDYLTMTLVDTPVLVVRGNDGRARVLLNACRHRGAAVAEGPRVLPRHRSGRSWIAGAPE